MHICVCNTTCNRIVTRPDKFCYVYFFFFFQAEDGIRDYKVTGVQTCALPIYLDQAAVKGYVAKSHELTLTGFAMDIDRKSTRLNSSHLVISYAVFCLKKKRRGRLVATLPSDSATASGPRHSSSSRSARLHHQD